MNIAFLASGNLGFHVLSQVAQLRPVFIATDSASREIITLAEQNAIPLFRGNPRNGRLAKFMSDKQVDLILSVNYLFLIEKDVLAVADTVVNFHGSLLPKYRGRTPHVWAIINNEKFTGVTAHLVDEGCDTGNIVLQKEMPILDDMTGGDVLRSFESLYPSMVMEIVTLFQTRRLSSTPQDSAKATWFGKRTAEDGLINWSWQKERIRNWVRAQADPYPGAYSIIDDERIVIDKIAYSDLGFRAIDPDGLILHCDRDSVIVKTPNGAVELVTIRNRKDCKGLITGKILK